MHIGNIGAKCFAKYGLPNHEKFLRKLYMDRSAMMEAEDPAK
jgi:hypothetical protein